MQQIEIKTADGLARAYQFVPDGTGPWPGVLLYIDAIGVRAAMFELGERLASHGYVVLLPDIFWRLGAYAPVDASALPADPEQRRQLFGQRFAAATPALAMADTRAWLDHLRALPGVKPGPVGTTGYCMGGALSLLAAGTYPDEIAAAASYHGGHLATDEPSSPHHLATRIKARIYVAGATDDPLFPDDMKARLERALRDAGVEHCVETYPARHGWVPRDTAAHDAAATERHWQSLISLFDATLKR